MAGGIAITPRALFDYRNMFGLTDAELAAGPILDCPGGASPFGAQARARGANVTSVDPAYSLPREAILERVQHNLAGATEWLQARSDYIDWSYLGSPAAHVRAFEVAADFFLTDYTPDGPRYVAASLPDLPFPARHFSLTLSSHLLFVYSNHFTFDDHIAALLELVRVTRGEVRVHPLWDETGKRYRRLNDARRSLLEHGVATEIRVTSGAWVRGGAQMLVCLPEG